MDQPMITVVCVYNCRETLEKTLLAGLKNQGISYDLVLVDNRDSSFRSAAAALNYGAAQAKGHWLLFAHQDVFFISNEWIASVLLMLEHHQPDGWVGVAGCDTDGNNQGFMIDTVNLFGSPFDDLMEVQTLDECLLMHKNDVAGMPYFDEGVPGWHAYGVEACCAAIRGGKKNYLVPMPVWHNSKATNLAGLHEAHQYVWNKHGKHLGKIFTTCGVLPDSLERSKSQSPPHSMAFADHAQGKLRSFIYRLSGVSKFKEQAFELELESLTEDQPAVEYLRGSNKKVDVLEAKAFIRRPKHERIVRHVCRGLNPEPLISDCVIVAPELTNAVLRNPRPIIELKRGARKIMICIDVDAVWKRLLGFHSLMRKAKDSYLVYTMKGKPVIIIEI
jgi:Glycosyltransferase like family